MVIKFLQWFSEKFNIHQSEINTWIGDTEKDFINNFEFQEKIAFAGHMIVVIMLLPVYVFMILFYKPLLLEFTNKIFKSRYNIAVKEVLESTKKIIQGYLVGLFLK